MLGTTRGFKPLLTISSPPPTMATVILNSEEVAADYKPSTTRTTSPAPSTAHPAALNVASSQVSMRTYQTAAWLIPLQTGPENVYAANVGGSLLGLAQTVYKDSVRPFQAFRHALQRYI
eukprot:IDg20125t1